MATAARVLIVDDHALLRDAIRVALELAGHEVVGEASDGYEAVRLVEELRPPIVLMDVMLPELDGIEATRRLNARGSDARVKREAEALELVADGYSTREVVSRLLVTDRTVRGDLSAAYGKLEARNRAEAVLDSVR